MSVALVHILNGALPLIAAGEIEIDVRPFAALFGQKSLEEKVHPDRIDRGDAERVADGAIGRGAASLHENVLFTAKADDVPDDQEIAGQIELFDQREFAIDLARAPVRCPDRSGKSCLRARDAKKLHLRFAIGNRIHGEFVSEVIQSELQARGKNLSVLAIASGRSEKETRHFRGRFASGARNCGLSKRPAVASVR